MPQQLLLNTTTSGIAPDDRRRLDLVIYGTAPLGGALCCDATLGAATQDGAVLRTALRRKHATYPELADGGAQALCVLGCEVGGRWSTDAVMLVRRFVALRTLRAPPAVRARVGAPRVERALRRGPTGRWSQVLDLADPEGPSRLP